jgi:hypothetical protein
MNTTRADEEDKKRWAFLYDIGCNIEKGIIKVELFIVSVVYCNEIIIIFKTMGIQLIQTSYF